MNKADIMKLMVEAMKAKDIVRTNVIRDLKNRIVLYEKDHHGEVPNDIEIENILSKMSKDRQKSIDAYTENNSNDDQVITKRNQLIDKEIAEQNIIKEFLPKEMTEDQIKEQLSIIISDVGNNFGLIMKTFNQKFTSQNSKIVSNIVKQMVGK